MAVTDTRPIQRRTVAVLAVVVALGGLGIAGSITAGGLLVAEVSGSDSASGLGQTAVILGGAMLAVPLARLSSRRGRRAGLVVGYGAGIAGALTSVLAAALDFFPLLLVGLTLLGGAVAAGMQARFAATDLAQPTHVSRDLSLVLWMTSFGAVLGPVLADPASRTAAALGLPPLAGIFLWSGLGFGLAMVLLTVGLRPDPLLLVRALGGDEGSPDAGPDRVLLAEGSSASRPSATGIAATRHDSSGTPGLRETLVGVRASPMATLALAAVVLAHATMIGLMVMTPLHLDAGGASLRIVGFVISVHVIGMYFFAPILGAAADRLGRVTVIAAGAAAMAAAGLIASTTAGPSAGLVAFALFLLGLGWSGCVVAGSSLLTASMPLALRPSAQGVTDLAMGFAGATAGALAGLVFGLWSYAVLGLLVAMLITPLVVVATLRSRDDNPLLPAV